MMWYVDVTDDTGLTFFLKTDNLEYLIAVTDDTKCRRIVCKREKEVYNINHYTELSEAIKHRKSYQR